MASRSREARQSASADGPFPKPRGACEKCRVRKTKCDNRRPSCGFCLKRRIACVYADDDGPSGPVTGSDILQAIHSLRSLVENQQPQQQQQSCVSCGASSTPAQTTSPSVSWTQSGSQQQEDHPREANSPPPYPVMRPQGVETVLDWQIFAPDRPSLCLFAQRNPPADRSYPMPDTSYAQLARLESKYINDIHTKNPILDLGELHGMMVQVAENGLDWSTQTCLVTLVCAIAAITESYPRPVLGSDGHPTPSPGQQADEGSDVELSMQFWNLAMKRLGYAASQNNVQAVQCLCLAGIWYMHRMRPLEAWKQFSLAGAAWHSLSLIEFPSGELVNNTGGSLNDFTVMQALYFTIWKSECELRLELPLPSPPVLDNTYFPLAFPQPPSISSQSSDPDVAERERGWYYYLTEIAARHLINRVLQMSAEVPDIPTERHVRRMIARADMMEAQIHDWYSSLPPMFYFDIPDGCDTEFDPDAMTFVLRHRYFTLRELVSRPFVRLCVDHLVDDIDILLRARVASFASQCTQFCMLKLSQTVAHRHQGTWYMLRITTTASLVLSAVEMAQSKLADSQASGAAATVQGVIIPEGWRRRVQQAVNAVPGYFDEPDGGASNLKKIIQAVLGTNDG
ncbi:putative C6 transcription factor [Ilyonectria robusta]